MNIDSIDFSQTIENIDKRYVNRYQHLNESQKAIANAGILRHLRACRRVGCSPDANAIREIIEDAIVGKRVYDIINDDESYEVTATYHIAKPPF